MYRSTLRATLLVVIAAVSHADNLPVAPAHQSSEQAQAKSAGCMSCHVTTDRPSMHDSTAVTLGCVDCHGGNAAATTTHGVTKGSEAYGKVQRLAHVNPRSDDTWNKGSSANPQRSYTQLNRETPEFVRFVNPADYRVVRESCGSCHLEIINRTVRSLMSTSAMFWGGASYNNGVLPFKNYVLGESYTRDGEAASISGPPLNDPHRVESAARMGNGPACRYVSGVRARRSHYRQPLCGIRLAEPGRTATAE
jgi:hypothetical protein